MIFFTKSKAPQQRGGDVRLPKNPRGETNFKLKPRQAILTKTIHKTRRQAGGFFANEWSLACAGHDMYVTLFLMI